MRGLLVVSGLLALGLLGAIVWQLHGLHPGALELQLSFGARRFGAVVHQWTVEDLARYRAHLPWDFALLASYGAFGWLLATQTATFAALGRGGRAFATWALPLAAASDAGENALHAWLTAAPRFDIGWIYPVAAGCAALKWALVLAWMLVLAWALLRSRSDPAQAVTPGPGEDRGSCPRNP